MQRPDDAGVYKISDEIAIIQTLDFFTPIVDDPYRFGQIAVANALSDVYAMGGVPKTAMNIVCFPSTQMDMSMLRSILKGGISKMQEAGVVLVGGHSVEDKELKYGLAVTGFIHPDHILTKSNLKAGDILILTKPLGTGIINTAVKGGLASDEIIQYVTHLMAALNKEAAEAMKNYTVHACTDITGFGLLGHLSEMTLDSGFGIEIYSGTIPVIPEALEYAEMGFVPAGAYNNRNFYEPLVDFAACVERAVADVLFDPQTSGGLLICVENKSASGLLAELKSKGIDEAAIIGTILSTPKERILVK